jgi:hypothetical protein
VPRPACHDTLNRLVAFNQNVRRQQYLMGRDNLLAGKINVNNCTWQIPNNQ